MNKSWFNCTVRSQKIDESGEERKMTESYLLDAYTYTEAEARITHVMTEQVRGAFEVQQITKTNYIEIFAYDDAEMWFRVKVSYVTYDDSSGKEKQSNHFYLVEAHDVQDAYIKTQEVMKGMTGGYVIPAITYTKIVEVIPYSEDEEKVQNLTNQGFVPLKDEVQNPNPEPSSSDSMSGTIVHQEHKDELS